jgi:hypothetical protein
LNCYLPKTNDGFGIRLLEGVLARTQSKTSALLASNSGGGTTNNNTPGAP